LLFFFFLCFLEYIWLVLIFIHRGKSHILELVFYHVCTDRPSGSGTNAGHEASAGFMSCPRGRTATNECSAETAVTVWANGSAWSAWPAGILPILLAVLPWWLSIRLLMLAASRVLRLRRMRRRATVIILRLGRAVASSLKLLRWRSVAMSRLR
jgi:hypothetical protein